MSTAHGGRGGVIINMSSVASRLGGLGGGAAYAASKGAIDSFTLALAREVAGHVNDTTPAQCEVGGASSRIAGIQNHDQLLSL